MLYIQITLRGCSAFSTVGLGSYITGVIRLEVKYSPNQIKPNMKKWMNRLMFLLSAFPPWPYKTRMRLWKKYSPETQLLTSGRTRLNTVKYGRRNPEDVPPCACSIAYGVISRFFGYEGNQIRKWMQSKEIGGCSDGIPQVWAKWLKPPTFLRWLNSTNIE